jgi:hypothetical protein
MNRLCLYLSQSKLITHLMDCRSGITFTQPRVHGMVYEPSTGEARLLDVDIAGTLKELGGIYDLFKSD